MSPNSELRLNKLTNGQNRENHFLPQLKAKRIVQKKSPKLSLNLTLHPLAPTSFFPCLYKLVWKVPLILSRVLALVTLRSHVKRNYAKKKIIQSIMSEGKRAMLPASVDR